MPGILLMLVLLASVRDALSQSNCSNFDPFATAEKRLRSTLLCNYDAKVIPLNPPEVTKLVATVKLDLKHILISEDTDTLKVTAWLTTFWVDGFLKWNESEYGGRHKIVMGSDEIWNPDLAVFNSDLAQVELFASRTSCVVESAGFVSCVPSLNTPIYCRADLTRWPYDTQVCRMEIGSWAYTGDELVVQKADKGYSMSPTIYFKNNVWVLKEVEARNQNDAYCCPNITHPSVVWTFTVQRHAGLYQATYIVPAFVLAGATLLSFWVKSLATRALLCCSAIFCTVLILTSLAYEIRATGEQKPDIVVAYRDSLLFTFVSLTFSIIIPLLGTNQSPDYLLSFASLLKSRGGRPGSFLLGPEVENGILNDDLSDTTTVMDGSTAVASGKPRCLVFANLLDRTAFAALTVLYFLMLTSLLP